MMLQSIRYRCRHLVTLLCVGVLASCAKEINPEGGKGRLSMTARIDSKTNIVVSKATTPPATAIQIRNSAGKLVRIYANLKELPDELWLLSGEYSATAITGENPELAFDTPYYIGAKEFTVTRDALADVELVSRLANAKVSVRYSDRIKTNFTAYQTTVRNTKGSLVFDEATEQSGYVKNNGTQTFLNWSLQVTNRDGQVFSREGVIEKIEPCNHYILDFDVDDTYEDGGLIVKIVVNTDAIEVNTDSDITLKKMPELKGVGFNIKEPFIIQKGSSPILQLEVLGTPALSNIEVTHDCALLTQNSIPTEFELLHIAAGAQQQLNQMGFHWTQTAPELMKLDLSQLCVLLYQGNYSEDGSYHFTFTVSDSYGKVISTELKMLVMGSDVVTVSLAPLADIWSHKATLRGRWVSDTKPNDLSFEVREAGSLTWTPYTSGIVTVDNENTFALEVTGLKASQKYDFRAKAGSDAANVLSFTTDGTPTIYNLSFDDWHKNGKVWYANALEHGAKYFWDSGNTGTTTISDSNTLPEETDVVSGKACLLKSVYAGISGIAGKFAAGNIYSGQFIKTIGTSGAQLEFGRPYTGRPTKLKGHYKYTPGTVNYAEGKFSHLKNTTDSCSIYILLCDRSSPYFIDTSTGSFIDVKNDPRIIAYGALPNSMQAINTYTPFEIDIVYRSTTRRPTYVVMVASASKYGDYFTGSTSSVLLIDEFSLAFD